MSMKSIIKRLTVATVGILAISTQAGAVTIFSDNFNDFATAYYGQQAGTGLTLGAFGSLGAWNAYGVNAVHAVDRSGEGDWAVMFYANANDNPNVIVSKAAFSNTAGNLYTVTFQGAGATYASPDQGNGPGDGIQFALLRNDGSVAFSYNYDPSDWTNEPENPFTTGSFSYLGDGSGDVSLSILGFSSGYRFGGAIDNVNVDEAAPAISVPEPAMIGLFGMGAIALGFSRRRRAA